MAKVIDNCCVSSSVTVQLTKPDKNNNTTANVDDGIIIPSEQCDLVENGLDDKSESTGDSDDRRLSSGGDEDGDHQTAVTVEPTTTVSSSPSNDDIDAVTPIPTATNTTIVVDPYKDFTGVDTESFITTTLRNNPKDRTLLLMLETVLQQFIQDNEQTLHQFQPMNSYERMIVHRVAAFFGLDHNVDKNGQAVVVSKTPNTRIPTFSFQKCIPEDDPMDSTVLTGTSTVPSSTSETASSVSSSTVPPVIETQTRRILRRHEKNNNHEHMQRNGIVNDDYSSHFHPSHAHHSSSKSQQPSSRPYSERVHHYVETRARIFNESTSSTINNTNNNNIPSASTTIESSSTNKLLSNINNNKTNNTNQKQHTSNVRPSYRKQHQNSSHQHRSYGSYHPHHIQQTTINSNNHMQQYPTGKSIDPSSHMLNASTTRTPPIYTAQHVPSAMPQPPMYASMALGNTGATSLRPPVTAYYAHQQQQQHQPIDYEYKQQTGPPTYNYVSMMPPTASFMHHQQQQPLHPSATGPNQAPPPQHATGMQIPILVQQQPGGQIQYLFTAPAMSQQQQQHQQQQQLPPSQQTSAGSYQMPDGQFVQLYRPDTLSLPGPSSVPSASIVDSNNTHHPYTQNQSYHQHHLSQQQPPSQSNPPPPPPPFVRIYPTATSGNISHPFAQGAYQGPPQQTTFVQPAPSYMLPPPPPPQSNSGVQSYTPFDNNMSFATYNPATTTKTGGNNHGAPVQYATTYLAALTLQQPPQHEDYQTRLINNPQPRFLHSNGSTGNQQRNFMGRPLVQSPNGSRMTFYQHRQSRPSNISSDKQQQQQTTPIENDTSTNSKQQTTNSDNIALAGPAQE